MSDKTIEKFDRSDLKSIAKFENFAKEYPYPIDEIFSITNTLLIFATIEKKSPHSLLSALCRIITDEKKKENEWVIDSEVVIPNIMCPVLIDNNHALTIGYVYVEDGKLIFVANGSTTFTKEGIWSLFGKLGFETLEGKDEKNISKIKFTHWSV